MFQWYVINTYSGHENKVKTNLEHRIDSLNQRTRFRRVVVPTEQVIETKEGQKVQTEKRVLPGYVLVNMDMTDEAWTADYADPFDFINVLLDGRNIQASNNNNYSYFNDPKYNQKMTAASLLSGAKRNSTYGALDVDLMQNAIPWAPRANSNDRIFVSGNFGCFTYNNIYGNDLAASCVK